MRGPSLSLFSDSLLEWPSARAFAATKPSRSKSSWSDEIGGTALSQTSAKLSMESSVGSVAIAAGQVSSGEALPRGVVPLR